MYKLIIIDDEKQIRDGLKMFISMSQREYEISGEFEDGNEAIEFLKTNFVDLIITDIKMTCVTGIDIMKFVYENYPDTLMIVVSGYQNFEYTSSAIEYRARYYLTKPTKYKELEKVFKNVTAELKEKYEKKKQLEMADLKSNFFLNDFFREIYSKIIDENIFHKKLKIIDEGNLLLNSKFAVISMGIADYENYVIQKWKNGTESFNEQIVKFVCEFFENQNISCLCIYHARKMFRFVVYSSFYEKLSDFIDFLKKSEDLLNESGLQKINTKTNLHISKAYDGIENFFKDNSIEIEIPKYTNFPKNADKIERVKEYVAENVANDISLLQVADHFHYNVDYLGRLFKQTTGESFSSYVINMRMNIAKELLKNTEEKLTDIATKVGYNDLSYFLKAFKKNTGLAPLEYKRKVKSDDGY